MEKPQEGFSFFYTDSLQMLKSPGSCCWIFIFCSSPVIDWTFPTPFIFLLWNQLKVSFAACFGSLSCCMATDSQSRISRYVAPFIFPSTMWILPVPREEKQPRTVNASTSELHCRCFRVIHRTISPPNMALRFLSRLTASHPSSDLQASPNVVQQTSNELQHVLSSVMESYEVIVHGHRGGGVLSASSRSFWSSFPVVLGSLATLLTNFLIARSAILWGAPVCSQLMVQWCCFDLR